MQKRSTAKYEHTTNQLHLVAVANRDKQLNVTKRLFTQLPAR